MTTTLSNNYGLNNSYAYEEFELDSLDASIQQDGRYTVLNWPKFELSRPLTNIAAIKIIEVSVPFSYYVFNSTNNTFQLSENGGAKVNVTIPTGNYNYTQMTTLLTTGSGTYAGILDSVSPGLYHYTATYDAIKNKYTIINNNTNGAFTLTFPSVNAGETDPSMWLGFATGANASALVATVPTLVAPYAQSVTGPNYLMLNSTVFGSQLKLYMPSGAYSGAGGIGPQICKIPINVNPGGVIEWQDPDPQKWFNLEDMANISFIDMYFSLGNSSLKPLDFNGQSFSLKMGVLINDMAHVDNQSGMTSQKRVVKRVRPY